MVILTAQTPADDRIAPLYFEFVGDTLRLTGAVMISAESRHVSFGRVALWFVMSASWVGQAFVPWTTQGPLATSSGFDAARLIGAGTIDDVIPRWGATPLLLLPFLGLLLMAMAGATAMPAQAVQFGAVAIGCATTVLAFRVIADGDPHRLGLGAWLTFFGLALGVVAVAASFAPRMRPDRGET